MYKISLIPKENIYSIIPLLKILDDEIKDEVLKSRLDEMILQNYECVGVYDNDKLIGISGLWTLTKYYIGKHIEPDNVVIHPDYRGKKVGEQLIKWIFEYAQSKGYTASELNCYVKNRRGVEFWKQHGYKIIGYHFQKQF